MMLHSIVYSPRIIPKDDVTKVKSYMSAPDLTKLVNKNLKELNSLALEEI
jgi:hypothetical protein